MKNWKFWPFQRQAGLQPYQKSSGDGRGNRGMQDRHSGKKISRANHHDKKLKFLGLQVRLAGTYANSKPSGGVQGYRVGLRE